MSMRRSVQILSILPLFALTACGDGWEMKPYTGFPYGERTAGAGIQYVLAKMAPEKGPVLEAETKAEEAAPAAEAKAAGLTPVIAPLPADELFNKAQKK